MALYRWQGRNREGRLLRGEMEAADPAAVAAELRRRRLQPLPSGIREKGKGLRREIAIPGFGPRVGADDIVMLTRNFAVMIEAGVPVVECLGVLADQTENSVVRKALRTLRLDVSGGMTLTAAMARHPRLFDVLFVRMVAAGEHGGVLAEVLSRLALFIERSARLKRKVRTAMVYPAAIVAVATAVVAVLLLYVIPVFAEIYQGMGRALPPLTELTIAVSRALYDYAPFLLAGLAAVPLALRMYCRTERGLRAVHRWLLRLPLLGDLLRKAAIARFSHNTGLLLRSGVTLLDSLAVTAGTAGNKVVERAVLDAREGLERGRTFAELLSAGGLFPAMVCHMVAVGESVGALDTMLDRVASFYEEEVDRAVTRLTTLMEPALMIVLGVVLGGIVISMYLPIFQMGGMVH
ncbi:MAG: type II secretion system F family protein [Deltaproteobacteria bacterium]|nr:type II secretion system F family protein [Deltaproteobacteria bacterium]